MNKQQRLTLNDLMRRLKDGDRSAFDPAYKLLWPNLLKFASALLLHPQDAEDAAQNALLKLFARSDLYDPDRDAISWAFTFVVYESRTLRRSRLRKKEVLYCAEAAVSGDLEDEVARKQLLNMTFSLIGDLKSIDREAILSAFNADDCSKGASYRKRLERALKRLKGAWERKYDNQQSTT